MQKSLKAPAWFRSIAVHSGNHVEIAIEPAPVGHGIIFERADIEDRPNRVNALYSNVCDTLLNTTIANEAGVSVSTVEHLMAAFAGLGITNALVRLTNDEIPILDGSSREYVRQFLNIGVVDQAEPALLARITKPVRVEREDGAWASLAPAQTPQLKLEIAFGAHAIGKQVLEVEIHGGGFVRELADCRTFCRFEDVEMMRARGQAMGGSLDNAVVVDGMKILNPGGLRRPDEFVRHKLLDAVGDLALCGAVMMGRYEGYKSGHSLNNALLRKAFSENALHIAPAKAEDEISLPGYNISRSDIAAA